MGIHLPQNFRGETKKMFETTTQINHHNLFSNTLLEALFPSERLTLVGVGEVGFLRPNGQKVNLWKSCSNFEHLQTAEK